MIFTSDLSLLSSLLIFFLVVGDFIDSKSLILFSNLIYLYLEEFLLFYDFLTTSKAFKSIIFN